MPKATDVVVASPAGSPPQSPAQMTPPDMETRGKKKEVKKTPLPLHQLFPLAFVLLSESLCGTMITPFVGLLVAKLQDWDPDQAGYASGMMVGMFALGQLCSSKTWGWISDEYGRRFPLISGLFTTGLMILGFGLSGNIWFCAMFRFGQGLFNGNMLVAKTVIADITDKTNEAQGFSFTSICSAVGFLIGPTLGGLLYDPCTQDWLQWAHFNEDGIFGRRPALLPCLVIFAYTCVGMLACTFFVQESNPQAKPLPSILKALYPCMWREAKPFVPARVPTDSDHSFDEDVSGIDENAAVRADLTGAFDGYDSNDIGSPVVEEDTRLFNSSFMEESLVMTAVTDVKIHHRRHRCRQHHHQPRCTADAEDGGSSEDGDERRPHHRHGHCRHYCHHADELSGGGGVDGARPEGRASRKSNPLNDAEDHVAGEMKPASGPSESAARLSCTLSRASLSSATTALSSLPSSFDSAALDDRSEDAAQGAARVPSTSTKTHADELPDARRQEVLLTPPPMESVTVVHSGEGEEQYAKFGYRQAFTRPYTRKMLTQYMILVAADNTAQQLFPLWCITTAAAGGLDMTSAQVGRFLLLNSIPLFCSNVCFHRVVPHYADKIGLFRIAITLAGVAVAVMPFMYYLPWYWSTYLTVFLCYSTRQFFCTWCYSLNTMLTARSAPPGFVGAIMGINQSCGAAMRAVMPFLSSPVYAWSVSGHHPIPLNHVLGFVLAGLGYFVAGYRSYSIRTNADGHLEIV